LSATANGASLPRPKSMNKLAALQDVIRGSYQSLNRGDGQLSELLFSIVIVCYNEESFVRQAVESALLQEHPSKEIIVVDDASGDGTADVLNTFGDSIIFARLPVNGGVAAARNHGASLASGKYLVFLDGDDVLMSWALEVYGRLIAARGPKLMLGRSAKCYGNVPEGKTPDPPCDIQFVEYANFLAKDRPCVFNTSTLVVDRSTFWSAGGWSPGIFYQDIQDLVTKLGVAGKMILVLAPDTVWYRMHSTNAVNKVSPFIAGIHVVLAKARAGLYPGGREHWVERSAWLGGLIFYWTKTAMRARIYRDGFILLACGWWMILFAVIRRGMAWLVGRKHIEILPLKND
jgi:glycosyltransferase involved in cell wall biosynthesis